jgi:hypothetical protein
MLQGGLLGSTIGGAGTALYRGGQSLTGESESELDSRITGIGDSHKRWQESGSPPGNMATSPEDLTDLLTHQNPNHSTEMIQEEVQRVLNKAPGGSPNSGLNVGFGRRAEGAFTAIGNSIADRDPQEAAQFLAPNLGAGAVAGATVLGLQGANRAGLVPMPGDTGRMRTFAQDNPQQFSRSMGWGDKPSGANKATMDQFQGRQIGKGVLPSGGLRNLRSRMRGAKPRGIMSILPAVGAFAAGSGLGYPGE